MTVAPAAAPRALVALTLAAALACAARPARAQGTEVARFALADAIRAMGRGHPTLAARRALNRAADYDVLAAGLWTNPQLNVNYGRSIGYTTYDPVIGAAQVGVSQFIETSGAPGARRRVAEQNRSVTQFEGEAARRALVFDVQDAFVRLVAAGQRLAVRREAVAQLERAGAIIRARVDAQLAPAYDLARMSLALADARAAVADAEADAMVQRGALDVAVGPEAGSLRGEPAFDLLDAPSLPALATLLELARVSRPDVAAARARARAAGAEIDLARRSVFQGVTLYGGLAAGQGFGPNNERQFDVVVGLTVPLPLVERGQATVPAAAQRAEGHAQAARALTVQAEQGVAAAHRVAVRRREALEAFRQAMAGQSASVLAQVEAAYREGHTTVQGLIDAYQAVRDARLREIELAADARAAEVSLWRQAGAAP